MSDKVIRWSVSALFAVVLSLSRPTPAFAAPPANDDFANAQAINSLPFSATVDNTEASAESSEPQNCSALGRSVWYSFVSIQDMTLRVDMSGSAVSGIVGIYLAAGPGISDLTALGCVYSDSSFNFKVEAGMTYYLRVDSLAQAGSLQINLQQIFHPANDDFAKAQAISSLPFSASVDNTDATSETGEGSDCFFLNRTVWYSFTPAQNMTIEIDTIGSAVGGVASIYLASGPELSDLTFLTCAANGSATNIHIEAGKTYYVQLDGDIGQTGLLQLNIEEILPPANDNFTGAEAISAVPFSATADTANATLEPDESQLSSCAFARGTVWYSFTPAEDMAARIDTTGSSGSGSIDIYLSTGPTVSDLTRLACAFGNNAANIQFEAGKTYYLRVNGDFGQAGTLKINLTQIFPPANDSFANAELISSLPFHATVDNTEATIELDEPSDCASRFRSVWYSFSPAENTEVRLNAFGSRAPGNVSIYRSSGSSISDLTFLTCATGSTSLKLTLEAGKTYYLRVDSYGQAGAIQINLEKSVPPANDNFANAEPVASLPFTATVDITDATLEPNEPQTCAPTDRTVWYTFVPSATMTLIADARNAPSPNVSIYRAGGPGMTDLQFVQCVSPGGAVTFLVEAGQTYYIQAGATFGQTGTVQFNLSQVTAITGRVTDAVTGAPLPGDGPPFAYVALQRVCGDGCLELVSSMPTNANGLFRFDSYLGIQPGTYQIEVSASLYQTKQFGPFEFSGADLDVGDLPLNPPSVIHGRVVASDTGSPLPGAFVTLLGCNSSDCSEYVNSQNTDGDGNFQFNSFSYGAPLPAGTYELEISATLYQTRRVEVTIGVSENRDMGDLLIEPVPVIGSISGRLVDAVTGKPIEQAFTPVLELYQCENGGCWIVSSMLADAESRFRFETDFSGNRLVVGSYKISASADQYDFIQTDIFEVGEDMHRTVGNIRLNSLPVRFSEVQPCADIPASGGECVFSVKISNGGDKNLTGKVWSLVYSNLPGSLAGNTNFQIKDAQDLDLGRGKSKVLRFRFSVPANPGPDGTSICPRLFVGEGPQALFNTIGVRDLFCVLRNAGGLEITSPQEAMSPVQANVTAVGTEIEPNNACQTAQDVGTVAGPFVLDGNLDSSAAPDIDFFRFAGTPGQPARIDLQGQGSGEGTLYDPFLGVFDSNCNLIALNDNSNSLDSQLELMVPADGIFVLAATACCDGGFEGGGNGSYQLTVTPIQLVDSISGVITDALNGTSLRGEAAPFTFVRLLRCETFGCFDVNFQNAGSDGSFHFETESSGAALRVGDYRIIASADQYQVTQTEMFSVGQGEAYDAGPIALNSYPIRFGDTQACSVPAGGGPCDFGVKVTNGLSTKFSGKVWSIIEGNNIGSFINFTAFQADSQRDLNLAPGKSIILRFRFRVHGSVANGASFCATAFAGEKPSPFFNAVGQRFLFCFIKGEAGFTLMSDQEMQAQLQHGKTHEAIPARVPSLPKK